MFEKYEKPMLKPLPANRYEFYDWKKAKVHIDYHVELEGHYYSVPYQFISKEVELCFNTKLVKILHESKVIASHQREYVKGKHSTTSEHMPKGHQEHSAWNVERFINWAKSIGPNTASVIERLLLSKPNPEINYRRCLGILRLSSKYSKERLEKACARLLSYGLSANPYQSLKNILVRNLDQVVDKVIPKQTVLFHENIRGPEEFA
jgi:transposase